MGFFYNLTGNGKGDTQTLEGQDSDLLVPLEPGPAIISSNTTTPEPEVSCDSGDVIKCLSQLLVFTSLNSLPFPETGQELDRLCEEADHGRNCTDCVHRTGVEHPYQAKEALPLLSEMSGSVSAALCADSSSTNNLRTALLEHAKTLASHADRLRCCHLESDLPDIPILTILEPNSESLDQKRKRACCPVNQYLSCARSVLPSDKSGAFLTSYVRLAAGRELEHICSRKSSGSLNSDSRRCPDIVSACTSRGGATRPSCPLTMPLAAVVVVLLWTRFRMEIKMFLF